MKKILFLTVCVMLLVSCTVNLKNWGTEIIEPSENIVTKEYNLTAFEEIDIHSVGNVTVIQSDSKNGVVELTAPDNYIELYKFESKNGKLDISFSKNGINIHTKEVKINVYTTDLVALKNSGAATIRMDSLDTDKIYVNNLGTGHFDLRKLIADDVEVKCTGVGDISLSGQTGNAKLSCSGVGSIDASNLKAQNVKATVSGVGSIKCYASEKIDGKVSGVGSLQYGGHPKQKNTSRPGIGSITEL